MGQKDSIDDAYYGLWYAAALESLSDNGILQSYPDGYFRGLRTVTRAELATSLARIVRRMKTPPELNVENVKFHDVAGNEWYYGAVLISAGTGLMNGYMDKTFRPDKVVTRAESAAAFARLLPLTANNK